MLENVYPAGSVMDVVTGERNRTPQVAVQGILFCADTIEEIALANGISAKRVTAMLEMTIRQAHCRLSPAVLNNILDDLKRIKN